ncbi:hypothetical protein V8G61_04660 [Gaetbulibacter sp. M240]|uniref:hypothetical protein n=1 Tax=Gaetbulibacter sp. M240 TaxID=3126511 RepID=UPI00374FAADB
MRQLIENGIVFCRPIEGFRKRAKERKSGGDILEGVTEIINYDQKDSVTLTIFPFPEHQREIKIKMTNGQFRQNISKVGNIYSLYSINQSSDAEQEIQLDTRMLEYGTHAVIITDYKEFLIRINKQAKSLGYNIFWGLMDYYNPIDKIVKDISIFHKSKDFKYESEFRIFVENSSGKDLKLAIGNITDIAQIIESNQLKQMKVNWR